MSGKRYLLDTNAVISLLRGDESVVGAVRDAEWVGISVITKLEFLCFPGLGEPDRELFQRFLERIELIGLPAEDDVLHSLVVSRRSQHKLKLPDAIIAAAAERNNALLMTADKHFRSLGNVVLLP